MHGVERVNNSLVRGKINQTWFLLHFLATKVCRNLSYLDLITRHGYSDERNIN